MWQIILTLVFYLWLFLVLWFLWAIWYDTSRYIKQMQQILIDSVLKTSEVAQKVAEHAEEVAKQHHADT